MLLPSVFVLFISCSLVLGKASFVARNCRGVSGATSSSQLKWAKLAKHPLVIPGKFKAAGQLVIKKPPETGKKYDLELTVKRHVLFTYVTIPCIEGYGSCTYDLCDFLSKRYEKGCTPSFTKYHLPCTCDQLKKKTYTLPMSEFEIVKEQIKSVLLYGDYKITVKVREHDTKKVVACLHLELTLAAPKGECDNILCDTIG